jgi:hypothetical protein
MRLQPPTAAAGDRAVPVVAGALLQPPERMLAPLCSSKRGAEKSQANINVQRQTTCEHMKAAAVCAKLGTLARKAGTREEGSGGRLPVCKRDRLVCTASGVYCL